MGLGSFVRFNQPNSRNFSIRAITDLAWSRVLISQKMRSRGSVPENRQMIQPPFLK